MFAICMQHQLSEFYNRCQSDSAYCKTLFYLQYKMICSMLGWQTQRQIELFMSRSKSAELQCFFRVNTDFQFIFSNRYRCCQEVCQLFHQNINKNMGCGSSSSRHRDKFKASVFPLTTAQKYLVRETWETIEIHKSSVGKKTFIKWV